MDIAAGRTRCIERGDQAFDLGGDGGVFTAHQQRVAAQVRHHRAAPDALAHLIGRRNALHGDFRHQLGQRLRNFERRGVLERDRKKNIGGRRLINILDNAVKPPHVIRVIGNHQRIASRVSRYRIIWRNQWPQNRHQLRGRFIFKRINLSNDAITRQLHARAAGGAVMLFGVSFGHDFNHAI